MKLRTALAALTLTLLASASAPARAEGEATGFAPAAEAGAGFGALGQIALSLGTLNDEPLFFHKSGGAWQLGLAPSADYFILPHVSVGGSVSFGYASGGAGMAANATGATTFGIAARAGYALGINDKFSVWPLGGLSFSHTSVNHGSSSSTALLIYAPALYHLAPHLFVGLGPSFRLGLSGGGNVFGLDSMLGGWF